MYIIELEHKWISHYINILVVFIERLFYWHLNMCEDVLDVLWLWLSDCEFVYTAGFHTPD